jgi:hypothetical protein
VLNLCLFKPNDINSIKYWMSHKSMHYFKGRGIGGIRNFRTQVVTYFYTSNDFSYFTFHVSVYFIMAIIAISLRAVVIELIVFGFITAIQTL